MKVMIGVNQSPSGKQAEPLYSTIFDRSPFALTLSRVPKGILVNVNHAFLNQFGFARDEVIGKTNHELNITDDETWAAVTAELQKSGFVHNYECTCHSKSGEILVVSLSLDWVDLAGEKYILTTMRDITAQKQADHALSALTVEAKAGRQRLIAMMQALPVGVAILDDKGGNVHTNSAFEQVWGSPRPPVDGVNSYSAYKAWWIDTGTPVQPEEWASAQAVQDGKTVTGQQMKIQRFDGSYAYVMNSAAPIFDDQGQISGCAVVIEDISDLKLHEDQVRQLNRTLKALSNCNQAVLRATNESGFLDEVSRIIVEDCGFAMVWIGYLQDDQRQSVKPVASAGFEAGYLESLDISLTDPERGCGPTGTAIRTGMPTRCNNMLTDPMFAPWRKAAIERGYASSIVLPLRVNDRVMGAINIYSREPDGFSDEEQNLLVELASDLGYGITTLRLRKERIRINDALQKSEEHYRTLFENMTEGFALHEIVSDEADTPSDYRFLEVNPAFERLTGLKRETIIGRLASEILPGLEPFWIKTFGDVALTGQPVHLENYTRTLGRYYRVYAYRPASRQFAVIFSDITQAHQAELELVAATKKYATLFNSTSDGVWIQDLEGVILEVNEAYCAMSGYSCPELIGTSISALNADENPQEIAASIQSLISHGGHDRFESRHKRKDGTIFDVDITALYMNVDGGRVAFFVRDITDRKKAEARLAYLASFPEKNPNPVVEVTLQGEVRYANPSSLRLFPNLMKLKAAHPWLQDWESVTQPFRHGKSGPLLRDVAYHAHCYQQSLTYIASEGVVRIYGIDISQRKQVEEALRLSEERYRTIVETAAEGIILSRPDGKYIYVNQQMASMLGYTIEEMIGKSGPDFMYDDQVEMVQQLRHKLDTGQVLRGEFKFRCKDGSALWSMYNATPIFNEKKEHVSNLAMHTDITERKLADEALRRARDELEHRVQVRTQELDTAISQLRAEISEREKTQTELESSLLELQVIEEELRNNNEMLVDAQKVLEEERQRYRDLFEFAPDAYLVTDTHGLIQDANQFTNKLFAIAQQNLIGKPLIVFVTQADHGEFNRLIASLATQHEIQTRELRMLPRHGDEIVTSVKVARSKEPGKAYSLRWTIRDITHRKQAEETIRQNALRNAVISEVSQSLASASLDEKAILDFVTQTTARLVGDSCVITMASADGQWLQPVAWHHRDPAALEGMRTLVGTRHAPTITSPSGRVYQASESMLIKQFSPKRARSNIPPGYRKYVTQAGISSLLVVPIKIGGQTIGTLGLTRDRTGQPYSEDDQSMLELVATRTGQAIHNARLYQELQAALRKELETHDQLVQAEKFAAVGRLLASITHEINNPLQTIKNCLYLSQVDSQPGTPVYDALTIATTETNRLSNLVAQLREIYRPPAQGLNKPVNLPLLVSEVQVLLSSYLQDKHVRWVVTPPQEDKFAELIIDGVADQIKQVFLNICLNAIDAMELKGGSLNIDFLVSPGSDQAGVCFRDTGPGLPQEVQAKLFEPFTTTKEKGLGLGLVICYDIIQKHNGHIEVASQPGEGAAFTIWLPARNG